MDENFGSNDAGASSTYPAQCSTLRENGHVVLKGRPCKIIEMSTSTTGKHGNSKVHLVGVDLFTGEKMEDIFPSISNVDVPNVSRKDFQLVNIENGYLCLMDDGGDMKEDIKLPENDIGSEIQEKFDKGEDFMVTVLSALGEEAASGTKQMAAKN